MSNYRLNKSHFLNSPGNASWYLHIFVSGPAQSPPDKNLKRWKRKAEIVIKRLKTEMLKWNAEGAGPLAARCWLARRIQGGAAAPAPPANHVPRGKSRNWESAVAPKLWRDKSRKMEF